MTGRCEDCGVVLAGRLLLCRDCGLARRRAFRQLPAERFLARARRFLARDREALMKRESYREAREVGRGLLDEVVADPARFLRRVKPLRRPLRQLRDDTFK